MDDFASSEPDRWAAWVFEQIDAALPIDDPDVEGLELSVATVRLHARDGSVVTVVVSAERRDA